MFFINSNSFKMLGSLWNHLSRVRKRQFVLILILMIIASFAEIISIGAVIPFLSVLTSPELVYQHALMQPVIKTLGITNPSGLILPLTIIFITSGIFAGFIRLTLLYAITRLSYATGADLSIDIYRRTLYQNYSKHLASNSSDVINSIINKTNTVIGGVLTPVLNLSSSVVLLVGIMSVLISIDVRIALIVFTGFGLLYFVVVIFTRQKLNKNSKIIANKSTTMIKTLQEGLGGIRDVLIDGSQEFYCKLYRSSDIPFRRASGNNAFISNSPRYVMEAVGITIIAWVAYIMTQQEGGVLTVIPILGTLAIGAQKLLPILQQAYVAYSSYKGSRASFEDVLKLLDQELPYNPLETLALQIPFNKEAQLKNLYFRYNEESPIVLNNINLTIKKGSRVGFVGETGSGKSTLLDILMGLLEPTNGDLIVDDQVINDKNKRSWQRHIAHVPQNIFLSDDTITSNIAFGVAKKDIDHQKVKNVSEKAQISEMIEQLEDGFNTFVGERGARLSGGQRQRIGIARALYKNADLLIFDEATSALDNKTEKEIIKSIEGLDEDLTILIIAHRLSTLKNCDIIIELSKDGFLYKKTYKEISNNN
jgi:ATP-binding cassette, subfamily B, bacterial PglK